MDLIYKDLTDHPDMFPQQQPLPLLVFALADSEVADPHWLAICTAVSKFEEQNHWINQLPAPLDFLVRYTRHGVLLTSLELKREKAPPYFRDAWGWPLVLNPYDDDSLLDRLPVL
jgi:hypothetical protein